MKKVKTLAFTGLRPHKLPWATDEGHTAFLSLKTSLCGRLKELIDGENVRRFISGMAMGIDMLCAEVVLELKAGYPDISLIAAMTHNGHDLLWPQHQRNRYARILERCDEIHAAGEESADNDLVEVRNRWMADNCDILFAVWDGTPGNAATMADYARSLRKEIIVLDPFGL